jgi:hypothetical protein
VKLAAALGLLVAGIDLRRTPEDQWFCLEVNPSPAFSCFEPETGPEIGPAIASLLSGCMRPALALHLENSFPALDAIMASAISDFRLRQTKTYLESIIPNLMPRFPVSAIWLR